MTQTIYILSMANIGEYRTAAKTGLKNNDMDTTLIKTDIYACTDKKAAIRAARTNNTKENKRYMYFVTSLKLYTEETKEL